MNDGCLHRSPTADRSTCRQVASSGDPASSPGSGRLRDEHGTELARSGGAVGADLLWAEEAHASGLVTRLYLPFPDQDTR
ncbi:hypothetical protein REH65_31270 [Saccharopolyspora sp. ID03-671]|uniref:hypothetical protein n=1 Tax=Saccharopolyspora sp. ID03-671 TaxID=3073066 RepID=UPI00324492E5